MVGKAGTLWSKKLKNIVIKQNNRNALWLRCIFGGRGNWSPDFCSEGISGAGTGLGANP